MKRRALYSFRLLRVYCLAASAFAQLPADQVKFFEKKIQPVLAESCYACHSAKRDKPMGGLRVDTRDGLRKGGESGPAIVPGDPDASLLVKAVSYNDPDLKMPPNGKLSDNEIADLTEWVKMGAPDPRAEAPPPPARKGIDFAQGRQFWALRPVKNPQPPTWPVFADARGLVASASYRTAIVRERLVPPTAR